MSITKTKEQIAEIHDGPVALIECGKVSGRTFCNGGDLKALADSHTALLKAARNWLASYRREFDESEDDPIVKELSAAIAQADGDEPANFRWTPELEGGTVLHDDQPVKFNAGESTPEEVLRFKLDCNKPGHWKDR